MFCINPQTVHTQIRLLLQEQSDLGQQFLLSDHVPIFRENTVKIGKINYLKIWKKMYPIIFKVDSVDIEM